jgi:hypothetical protein
MIESIRDLTWALQRNSITKLDFVNADLTWKDLFQFGKYLETSDIEMLMEAAENNISLTSIKWFLESGNTHHEASFLIEL